MPATEETERCCPGRMYVGIHAPGLGSVQTAQVRTFSALLQAPATFATMRSATRGGR